MTAMGGLDLFVRLHARPGRRDELFRAILEVRGPTRAEPGCLDYQVYHSVRDPDEYCLHTRWRDRAAFDVHAELPHTVRFLEVVRELTDNPFHASLTRCVELEQPDGIPA